MIKNIVLTILIISLVLIFYKPSSNLTKIKFATWGSKSEVEIIKPLLKEFENKNPGVFVEFMHIPQNYFQKIHLLFASNTAPDVIFLNNHYLPMYADANLLEPLEKSDEFYSEALKALSWKGVLYAVPRDISSLVIFYNKDLFKKNNVPYPHDDWTMQEFLETAKKMTNDGVFGISFEEDSLFYLPYLMSFGGGILSDDLSELIIDSPNSIEALEFYSNLRKKYHVAPLKSESASATMAQMFLQQRLAMHLSGRWLVPKYRLDANFDWDVVRFPAGACGSIVPLDASGWAITKSSKNKDLAYKLVNFLSSKQSSQKFTESGLITPARKDVAESEYFIDNHKPQNAKVFIDAIVTSKSTPVSVNYNEVLDILYLKTEKFFN